MSIKKISKCGLYQLYRPRAKKGFRYSPPIVSSNDDEALNAFRALAKTHPELQYSYLYHVGEFNPISGKIKVVVRRLVCSKEVNKDENKA